MVRRSPTLWAIYHGYGKAAIEDQTPSSMRVVVRGAPELPSPLADVISGHILALAHVTKTKNATVRVESRNPEAWSWMISWEN
jgi:hypothetical protein